MDFTQLLATGEAENNSCPSASNPAVPHASQAHGHMEPDEVHGEAVRPVDEEGGAVWQPFEHAEEERILDHAVHSLHEVVGSPVCVLEDILPIWGKTGNEMKTRVIGIITSCLKP